MYKDFKSQVYYKQFYNEYFNLVHSSCSNNNYFLIVIISYSLVFLLCHAKNYVSKVN